MLLMLKTPRRSPATRAPTALSHLGGLALRAADAILVWPFRAGENRRVLNILAAMDEHELRDIGLSRQDLRDATTLPVGEDLGRFFAIRRRARGVRP